MEKTISAISTPHGAGGIGVIRISGDNAREVANKIFFSRNKSVLTADGYTAIYGKVKTIKGEVIDDCIALVFATPKSYTGEDVVELSCHGGIYIAEQVLKATIDAGATLAEPGEFTKRAFLNGKLDLTEAEAVMDIISAKGKRAAQMARSAKEGALFKKITSIKDVLVKTQASLLAWVDYPDDDIPDLDHDAFESTVESCKDQLETLLDMFDSGMAIKEGISTAIVGKPNVGKSTLMNLLTGYDKSIVTKIPGTTRDVVEETVRLGDVLLNLSDTAGIRETSDIIEEIGINKAKAKITSADLVLAVLDSSVPLQNEDKQLLCDIKEKQSIVIINKTDLDQKIDMDYVNANAENVILMSAANANGLKQLENLIEKMFRTNMIDVSSPMLVNQRQRECVVNSDKALIDAVAALKMGQTYDAVSVCIDDAISSLGELTGETAKESVVNQIFSKFCVGK